MISDLNFCFTMNTLFGDPRKTIKLSKAEKEEVLQTYDEVKNGFKASMPHGIIVKEVCGRTGVHRATLFRYLKERGQTGKVSSPKKNTGPMKFPDRHAPYTRNEKIAVVKAHKYVCTKNKDMPNGCKIKEVRSITGAKERTVYKILQESTNSTLKSPKKRGRRKDWSLRYRSFRQ